MLAAHEITSSPSGVDASVAGARLNEYCFVRAVTDQLTRFRPQLSCDPGDALTARLSPLKVPTLSGVLDPASPRIDLASFAPANGAAADTAAKGPDRQGPEGAAVLWSVACGAPSPPGVTAHM